MMPACICGMIDISTLKLNIKYEFRPNMVQHDHMTRLLLNHVWLEFVIDIEFQYRDVMAASIHQHSYLREVRSGSQFAAVLFRGEMITCQENLI